MRWITLSGAMLLASCAHLAQRNFAETVSRFQSDASFREQAIGPQLWVTETTTWQDAQGFDRTVSCTAIRPFDWFTARGYRMIPTAEEAARQGLVLEQKVYSPTTAAVKVGSSRAPPDAIYNFYRDDGGEWGLSGVEIFSRLAAEDGTTPAYPCVATE
jgi:hypothetical protein